MAAKVSPGVLYAEQEIEDGAVVSVALVRTRWPNQGHAVVERTTGDGGIDLIEHCSWFLRSSDEGPATLYLDGFTKALDDAIDAFTLNLLLDRLVASGADWGFEGKELVS